MRFRIVLGDPEEWKDTPADHDRQGKVRTVKLPQNFIGDVSVCRHTTLCRGSSGFGTEVGLVWEVLDRGDVVEVIPFYEISDPYAFERFGGDNAPWHFPPVTAVSVQPLTNVEYCCGPGDGLAIFISIPEGRKTCVWLEYKGRDNVPTQMERDSLCPLGWCRSQPGGAGEISPDAEAAKRTERARDVLKCRVRMECDTHIQHCCCWPVRSECWERFLRPAVHVGGSREPDAAKGEPE